LTNEELKTLCKTDQIEDKIILKINQAIVKQFFKEMLSKFLQLCGNKWLKITEKGIFLNKTTFRTVSAAILPF